MAKDPEQQMAFEFQAPSEEQSATAAEHRKPEASPPATRSATVCSLTAHRAAQISEESARHFSAILNLVAHLK